MIEILDSYLIEQTHKNRQLISPYKFALRANVELRAAIQFFLYFSDENGIFDIRYFFDCSNFGCGDRIYLTKLDLNEGMEHIFHCPECGKKYVLKNVLHFLKTYFEIKEEILKLSVSVPNTTSLPYDPNSTFLALKEGPDNLKVSSPSSSVDDFHDEGDFLALDTTEILHANEKIDGGSINNELEVLSEMALYLRG